MMIWLPTSIVVLIPKTSLGFWSALCCNFVISVIAFVLKILLSMLNHHHQDQDNLWLVILFYSAAWLNPKFSSMFIRTSIHDTKSPPRLTVESQHCVIKKQNMLMIYDYYIDHNIPTVRSRSNLFLVTEIVFDTHKGHSKWKSTKHWVGAMLCPDTDTDIREGH